MERQKLTKQFKTLLLQAAQLSQDTDADALLVLLEGPLDWEELRELVNHERIIVAADEPEHLAGASDFGLAAVPLHMRGGLVQEKLTQALLESVADDLLGSRANVVAVYSALEADNMDTISVIHLGEHLERLTGHDLRRLETSVPLDTLKTVIELAMDIGREGREGKPVGTMFVVGDTRKVLAHARPTGFDPVKGYSRQERNLDDSRVREAIKEIAQMDGAFVVAGDGTVEAAVRYIDAPATDVTLSKGLGARHWAAASISRVTKAVAVTVSESSGTVRVFQNGEVVLRIEPFRRPMKWKGFDGRDDD
jgi:DNA integrity scanning protein DisA with diadenylate cyclase activity